MDLEEPGAWWDANWLNIAIHASDGLREWSAIEPALLTTELSGLVSWMRNVADGHAPTAVAWAAIEPLLSMSHESRGEVVDLTVTLAHQASAGREPSRATALSFLLTPVQLREFAAALEVSAVKFPERGETTHSQR